MKRIAQFEKVSFEQYAKDFRAATNDKNRYVIDEFIRTIYDKIILPERKTTGSAGYDFHIPVKLRLEPGKTVTIPTGIRCRMEDGWVLMLYPRSGLGFKYKMQLNNTVGVIDQDYYFSDNEGHIMAKITNDGTKVMELNAGDGFMQGIFMNFGITADDDATGVRNGGFGSTDNQK